MAGSESLTEHYEFSSMEHIFDQHKQAGMALITQPMIIDHILWSTVTAIRFSNDDKTRLACCSQDGNLSVFDLSTDPPSISCTLKGHTHSVNG